MAASAFAHTCRACLSAKGDMRPLYGTCLDTMLMTVAEIQVETGDGLPETLCVQCVLQVSRTFTFKKLCQRSDTALRKMLAKAQASAAPIDITVAELHDMMSITSAGPADGHADAMRQTTDDSSHLMLAQPQLPVLNESDTHILGLSTIGGEDSDVGQHIGLSLVEGVDEIIDMPSAMIDAGDMMAEGFDTFSNDACDDPDASTFLATVDSCLFDEDDDDNNDHNNDTSAVQPPALSPPSSADAAADPTSPAIKPPPPPNLSCGICHKRFAERKVLRRHLKIHCATKPHRCNVCDMSFAESSNLTKHQKKHTGELRNVIGQPNLCSVCGKRFKWASSLSKHMKHHTRHNILQCPHCPKYYVEARSLNIHLRGHTGEKPFVCAVCQKAFTQMGNLDKHMRVHTGEKPYACPLCGKGFSQSGYVAIHVRTHTGERPYRCADCGKGFAGSNTLAIHRRTHTGERPYACTVCGRRFARQETAMIHERTHTGEKPHVCPVCQRGFTSSGHLTGHMRSHSGEKRHACEVCGKRFAGTGSLKVHQRSHVRSAVAEEAEGQQQQQHLTEQPTAVFVCAVCEDTFGDCAQLEEHELQHELEVQVTALGDSSGGVGGGVLVHLVHGDESFIANVEGDSSNVI